MPILSPSFYPFVYPCIPVFFGIPVDNNNQASVRNFKLSNSESSGGPFNKMAPRFKCQRIKKKKRAGKSKLRSETKTKELVKSYPKSESATSDKLRTKNFDSKPKLKGKTKIKKVVKWHPDTKPATSDSSDKKVKSEKKPKELPFSHNKFIFESIEQPSTSSSKNDFLSLDEVEMTKKRRDRSSPLDSSFSNSLSGVPLAKSPPKKIDENDGLPIVDRIKLERGLSPMSISSDDEQSNNDQENQENQRDLNSSEFMEVDFESGRDVDFRNPNKQDYCELCPNKIDKRLIIYQDRHFFVFVRPERPAIDKTFIIRNTNHAISYFSSNPDTRKSFQNLKFKLVTDTRQSDCELFFINYFFKSLNGCTNHYDFICIPMKSKFGKGIVNFFIEKYMPYLKGAKSVEVDMLKFNEKDFSYEKISEFVGNCGYLIVECGEFGFCYKMQDEETEKLISKNKIEEKIYKCFKIKVEDLTPETFERLESRCRLLKKKFGFE